MLRVLRAAACGSRWVRTMATATSKTDDYDVVIVGAGMVGAALASSLSAGGLSSSLRVALLDAKVPEERLQGALAEVPEMRVSTLTPATVELLQNCGAWNLLSPPNSAAVEYMQNMGYVAENSLIQSALIQTLKDRPAVDCIFPVNIQSIQFPTLAAENSSATVQLDGGRQLRTRLVVGADGAGSRVRTLAGILTSGKDYQQRGLVATVEVSQPNGTAWQRFLPTGPFALLPVRNGYFNIVWSTTEEVARAVESANEAAAVEALNEALHGGGVELKGSSTADLDAFCTPPSIVGIAGGMPRSFPLKRQLADKCVGARMALVGDAYRVVHPLAGQGANLGFADVLQLRSALEDAVRSGQDLGDPLMLQRGYEQSRRFESHVMMTALDAVRELFSVQGRPFQAARGMGLGVLNLLKPVKNEIMLYAMGIKSASAHLKLFR